MRFQPFQGYVVGASTFDVWQKIFKKCQKNVKQKSGMPSKALVNAKIDGHSQKERQMWSALHGPQLRLQMSAKWPVHSYDYV